MTFKAGDKTVLVSFGNVSDSIDNTSYNGETSQGVEKVTLNGNEALYSEKQSDKGYRSISWVTKNKMEISVSTPDDVSKAELLAIAKKLN